MQTYDLPVSENLTPEEAAVALERLWAAVQGDDQHPYIDQSHPQHRRFVAGMHRLYEMKNAPAALGPPLSDEDQADLRGEIERLQATPGYFSGALRQESLTAYTRLVAKIGALYQCLAEGRAAAEQAAAEAVEAERPDAETVAETELAEAVARVREAEPQEDEPEKTEVDDGNDNGL